MQPTRVRPAAQQLGSGDRPNPGLGQQHRGHHLHQHLPGLLLGGQGSLGGQQQRPNHRAMLDQIGGRSDQDRARLRLPKPGSPAQLSPQRSGQ
jgi:hypothetical protein